MIELKDEYIFNFNKAAQLVRNSDDFRIFSHYDADGISSAIIIVETLRRLGKRFHLSFLKSFDVDIIKEGLNKTLILSDIGADGIAFFNMESTILIDHHTSPALDEKKIIDLNPRSYGYDGSREACSSTVAFLLSLNIDDENRDLFPYFISGIIGDKQDVGGYYGINSRIIESYGNLYPVKKDLNIDGESIFDALYYSTDPYFNGLSGEMENVRGFLADLGIDGDSRLEDLNDDNRTKLSDHLMLVLLRGNTANEGLESLVTDKYFFKSLGMTGHLLSSYIDYAGRSGEMGLPLSWMMGNDEALDNLKKIWISFKEDILKEVKTAIKDAKKMKYIQYFHVNSPSLAGTVAGICMLYLLEKDKPTIGIYKNKNIKISSRATWDLVRRGIDLSKAISMAASEVGGHGGGHDIASGGEIPFDKEDEFLQILDKIIGDQLGNT